MYGNDALQHLNEPQFLVAAVSGQTEQTQLLSGQT